MLPGVSSSPFAQQIWKFVATPTPLTRLPTAFRLRSFRSPARRASATVAPPTDASKQAPPPYSSSTSSSSSPSLSSSLLSSQSSFSPRSDNKALSVLNRTALVSNHFSSSSTPQQQPQQQKMSFTIRKIGQPNTLEHRVYIEKDGVPLSPFHDIPLYANEQQGILNMVVEIPRWTNAKQEVCAPSCSLHGH